MSRSSSGQRSQRAVPDSTVQLRLFDDLALHPELHLIPLPTDSAAPPTDQPAGPRTLRGSIDDYLSYLGGLGRSLHTIRSFRFDLKLLLDYLGDRAVESLRLADLVAFITWVRLERANGAVSLRRKIATLKDFCGYLYQIGDKPENIADRLIYPDIAHPLPRFLEPAEVERLLLAAADHPLWATLLLFMVDTGLKRDEILALRPSDLVLSGPEHARYVVVRMTEESQRLRSRQIPLTARVCAALVEYIATQKPVERLFPLSQRGVNFIVESCGQNAGVAPQGDKLTPQVLRETFAVAQMRARLAREEHARQQGNAEGALMALMLRHNQDVVTLLGVSDSPENARKYRQMAGGIL